MIPELCQFPAELTTYRTYATKQNVLVSFELQEALQPEDIAKLLSAKGKTGYLVFSPSEEKLKPEDIPDEPVKETSQKTPSARLRACLYIFWSECTDKSKSWDRFYEDSMEKIIQRVKDKLPV